MKEFSELKFLYLAAAVGLYSIPFLGAFGSLPPIGGGDATLIILRSKSVAEDLSRVVDWPDPPLRYLPIAVLYRIFTPTSSNDYISLAFNLTLIFAGIIIPISLCFAALQMTKNLTVALVAIASHFILTMCNIMLFGNNPLIFGSWQLLYALPIFYSSLSIIPSLQFINHKHTALFGVLLTLMVFIEFYLPIIMISILLVLALLGKISKKKMLVISGICGIIALPPLLYLHLKFSGYFEGRLMNVINPRINIMNILLGLLIFVFVFSYKFLNVSFIQIFKRYSLLTIITMTVMVELLLTTIFYSLNSVFVYRSMLALQPLISIWIGIFMHSFFCTGFKQYINLLVGKMSWIKRRSFSGLIILIIMIGLVSASYSELPKHSLISEDMYDLASSSILDPDRRILVIGDPGGWVSTILTLQHGSVNVSSFSKEFKDHNEDSLKTKILEGLYDIVLLDCTPTEQAKEDFPRLKSLDTTSLQNWLETNFMKYQYSGTVYIFYINS